MAGIIVNNLHYYTQHYSAKLTTPLINLSTSFCPEKNSHERINFCRRHFVCIGDLSIFIWDLYTFIFQICLISLSLSFLATICLIYDSHWIVWNNEYHSVLYWLVFLDTRPFSALALIASQTPCDGVSSSNPGTVCPRPVTGYLGTLSPPSVASQTPCDGG